MIYKTLKRSENAYMKKWEISDYNQKTKKPPFNG